MLTQVLTEIEPLSNVFDEAGHHLYLVGGIVRDIHLGVPLSELDFDLTTDARPEQIKALALELGAPILAGAPFVSVRADGAKKSISGPGAGNYLTVAEAMATLRNILGDERLKHRGMVQVVKRNDGNTSLRKDIGQRPTHWPEGKCNKV